MEKKSKPTIVLGASTNPTRYSFLATNRLLGAGHLVFPVGIKKGEIAGIPIINHREILHNIDNITLYLGPNHQEEWKSYILETNPNRVIFNPGTENPEFEKELIDAGIDAVEECTLVLLSTSQY
ncbi:MAG: CoA-binding protein [Flavobacteriales bacterium]